MELDPAHVDTAIHRWQSLTVECARHQAGDRSFDLAGEAEVDDTI